jgi:hypothetical protein
MFYFDARHGVIRWLASGSYILSWENGPVRNGRRLVVKGWKGGNDQT